MATQIDPEFERWLDDIQAQIDWKDFENHRRKVHEMEDEVGHTVNTSSARHKRGDYYQFVWGDGEEAEFGDQQLTSFDTELEGTPDSVDTRTNKRVFTSSGIKVYSGVPSGQFDSTDNGPDNSLETGYSLEANYDRQQPHQTTTSVDYEEYTNGFDDNFEDVFEITQDLNQTSHLEANQYGDGIKDNHSSVDFGQEVKSQTPQVQERPISNSYQSALTTSKGFQGTAVLPMETIEMTMEDESEDGSQLVDLDHFSVEEHDTRPIVTVDQANLTEQWKRRHKIRFWILLIFLVVVVVIVFSLVAYFVVHSMLS